MAIIIATVDTELETFSVTINGTEIPNVCDVTMCMMPEYDMEEDEMEECCYVGISTKSVDESGLTTRTYISKSGIMETPPDTDRLAAKAARDIRKLCK